MVQGIHGKIVVFISAISVASMVVGMAYGLWSKELVISGTVSTCGCNADFIAASSDDPTGTTDPGYEKNVASCDASLVDSETIQVSIENSYPSYSCTITAVLQNGSPLTETVGEASIDAPPEVTVIELGGPREIPLEPGETDEERFRIHVEQIAAQGHTYSFTIRKPVYCFDGLPRTGTIDFWKDWDSHNTYTEEQIEGWLVEIDGSSGWLGPTTAEDMVTWLEAHGDPGATAETRFLAQYLATRLNERSGIIPAMEVHDLTGVDPGNYLGLADPAAATIGEIIAAIEGKYGTSPTAAQFNIMHEMCDKLNYRDI